MKKKHLEMYMAIAEAVASTSSAIRLKVGAVAVKGNMVIGTGYNGLASGIDGACENKIYMKGAGAWLDPSLIEKEYPYTFNGERYKLETRPEVHHAEKNLIINLAKSTESSNGCSIFLTHSCCADCSRMLLDAGIEKLYYRNDYRSDEGLKYLKSNSVEVIKL